MQRVQGDPCLKTVLLPGGRCGGCSGDVSCCACGSFFLEIRPLFRGWGAAAALSTSQGSVRHERNGSQLGPPPLLYPRGQCAAVGLPLSTPLRLRKGNHPPSGCVHAVVSVPRIHAWSLLAWKPEEVSSRCAAPPPPPRRRQGLNRELQPQTVGRTRVRWFGRVACVTIS